MRQPRVKILKSEGTGVYHCISRIVAGERLLGEVEREALRKTLWRVADFSGVEVLAYCLLSNHIHLLVRVPEVRPGDLSRPELLRRYRILYGDGRSGYAPDPAAMGRLLADAESAEAARWERRLQARMNDVSEFLKTLKQRFTTWFNKSRGRFGTLWAERFKSTLVENDPAVLQVVAAYIDLNPVRAGLVDTPDGYRWSSYGEALGGCSRAQRGLAAVMGHRQWTRASADYRLLLYGKGSDGRVGAEGIIPPEKVLKVLAEGGKVPLAALLRCQVRYFSDGVVLGSKAFVMEMEDRLRGRPSGRRRKRAAIPVEALDLASLRRPRKGPIA